MNHSKNLKTALLATAVSLVLVSAASAQTTPSTTASSTTGSSMYGMGKGYVGFNAGETDFGLNNGTGLFSNDRKSTAFNLYVGTYFNNNFGVELGYINFGTVNRGGGSSKAEGLNLAMVARVPLSESFNLLGKLGTTYGRTDVSSQPGSGIPSGSDTGFGLAYGIGAEYAFNPQLSMVLQYDVHQLHYVGAGDKEEMKVTSLGLRYKF